MASGKWYEKMQNTKPNTLTRPKATFKDDVAETIRYAQQSDQNTQEVANTLNSGMLKYDYGDTKNWSFDTARNTQIYQAIASDIMKNRGLFNSKPYAYNKGYVHLVGEDYLRQLKESLTGEIATSKQKDADMQALRGATAETSGRWIDLFKNKDDETEFGHWNNLLMADYLLGDRGQLFDYEAINAGYEDMTDDEYDRELQRLEDQWNNLDWEYLTGSSANKYESQTATLEGYLKVIEDELTRGDELDAMKAGIRAMDDYGTLSAYSGITMDDDAWIDSHIDENDLHAFNDLYGFLNNNASWEQKNNAREKLANVAKYMDAGYDYLTPDELADYNYLYNSGRTEEAARYLELLRPELLYRRAMVMKEYQSVKATNPLLAAPTWVDAGINQIANVFFLPQQMYETATGRDNPYSPAYDRLNSSQWTTEAQVNWIQDANMAQWLKDTSTVLYKGASGFRDNVMRLASVGFNPTYSLIMAGAQSTSHSLHESSERNDMDAAAKIIKALGTGAIEMGTEKVGLDVLFDRGQKGAVEYMLGAMASEVGEETLNAMSEPVLEAVVAFLFDHEAEIMSGEDFWKNLTDTMITTAISSFFMAGGSAAQMDSSTRKAGKQLKNNGDLETMLNLAENLGDNIADSKGKYTEAENVSKEIRAKLAGGQEVGVRELGRLVGAVQSGIGKQHSGILNRVYDDAITDRLVELGEDETAAKELAPAIRRMTQGEKIPLHERVAIKWTDAATQVFKELNTEIKESENPAAGNKIVEGQRVGQTWKTELGQKYAETAAPVIDQQMLFNKALRNKDAKAAPAPKMNTTEKAVSKGIEMAKAGEGKFAENAKPTAVAFDLDGNEIIGDVKRVKLTHDGVVAVVEATGADGKATKQEIAVGDITATKDSGVGAILAHIDGAQDRGHDMTDQQANAMLHAYEQEGGDAKTFIDGFEDAYFVGYMGAELGSVGISDGIAKIAYEQGKAEAATDESNRVARATRARADSKGEVTFIGKVKSSAEVKGKGDPNTLKAAMKKMTGSQQTTARIVQAFAKKFKTDVVLFESDANNIGDIENGSYDPNTNTIYIDINSGANSAAQVKSGKQNTLGYAMVRTLGHELTHHLESTSSEGYAAYKNAVKKGLKENGEDWAKLVRNKLDNARMAGIKLTYAGAEAEVVADASEYILQNSKFVKEIDDETQGKVKKFIKNFMQKLREVFQQVTGGHRESKALRETIDGVTRYLGDIQNLWDAAMEESIGREVSTESVGEQEALPVQMASRDRQYMEAVDNGDMETAQKMVDEAAKEAGYTVKAYHGTPTGGFTVFDRSYIGLNTGVGRGRFSFTSDKGTANAYAKANKGSNANTLVAELNKLFEKHASAEMSELFIGDSDVEVVEFDPDIVIAEGAIDHGYIDFDYDWRDETPDKYSSESEAKEAEAAATFDGTRLYLLDDLKRMQRGAPANTKAFFEEAIRMLETASMNATPQTYSVYIKRPGTTYSADARTYNSTAWNAAYDRNDVTEVKLDNGESRYFVTSPESIKSADPVTYDGNGNVIPLSERFNTANADIRYSRRDEEYMDAVNSGDTSKARQLVAEAAKEAGYKPLRLYHGTRSFGFTKFDVGKSDDKLSIFATDSLRIAESYSGENANRNLKNASKEDRYEFLQRPSAELLPYVHEHIGEHLRLPTEREMRDYTDEASTTILEAFDAIQKYLDDHNDTLRIEAKQALTYMLTYAEKMAKFMTLDMEDEADGYMIRMKYEDAKLDLSFEDRDAYDALYDVAGRPVIEAANKLLQARFSDPFYNEKTKTFVSKWDVTDRLGDAIFSGIYDLYGIDGNLFEMDANDANWNTLDGSAIGREGVFVNTRAVAEYAKENGYDGVLIKNVRDGGGMTPYHGASNVFIYFNNTALKSADLVTYDDDGNVIPLSERFNSANEDIRYSLREDSSEAIDIASKMETSDGHRMFSLRSFSEDYYTYREMLQKHGTDPEEVDALFHVIDEVMKDIEANREILDFGWNVGRNDRSFSPIKPNSDSLYVVSMDFSTLCRKRLLQQAVQERLETMYDTVLTKAERVAIRNELMKLREEGKQIEVACALCYVESVRLKSPAQIQRFFNDQRAVMVDYFAKKNKSYMDHIKAKADELIVKFGYESGTPKNSLKTKFQRDSVTNLKQSMYKQYKPTAEEEAIIATALSLPGESYKTDTGLWNLKKEHEVIFDAYTSFVRNATKSKGIEGDEAWWAGDSQSISDKLIEKMNAENGLRTQSWSDFQVIHLLDYISAIIELSTRGAKMQSYTKVPDFVNLMGDTGMMINLSLIPKGFDGTLNYDPIEGMPIETALALREMFPNTVGTICIGITKKHIEMLLADPNTDYVIPYHSSSLDAKTRQKMGMKVWQDFQPYQSEKNKDYPNTDSNSDKYHKKPLFSEWFDYDTVSARAKEVGAERAMQEAADRYKELCHQRGLQEKFEQFSGEPNYWKLLIDRKMINQKTGEIIKQEAVKPRFDLDRIRAILSAEVKRFKEQNEDFNEAVAYIERRWADGDIRKAAKSKKVKDAVSAFEDTVTVANIVESAKELDNVQRSLRDMPEEISTREFLTDADSSIAETIEERNALTIYQKLLKNHAEASEAVIAAEERLERSSESDKPEARKALTAARAKQKDLYNRLLNVERTAHVQTVVKRSQQIISDLYGKNQTEMDNMVSALERKVESLKADLQGLKGAAKTQREADIRAAERNLVAYKSKAVQALLANNEKHAKRMADLYERAEMNTEISKHQRHIKRIVRRLDDRIRHEEDYKNVKEPLKPAVHKLVRTFIDGFGGMVFDTKTADRLRTVYDAIANEDGAPDFYSDDVANWLTDLAALAEEDHARRTAGGSTLESVQWKLDTYSKVAEIADHIYKMVTTADEIFINGKRESFAAISGEVGGNLVSRKDKPLLVGKARDTVRVLDDLLRTGNLTPTYFFQHLNNSGLNKLFGNMMDGQTKYAQAIRDGQEVIAEAKRKYGFYGWQNMKQGVEFRTEQGHDIAMTVPQMMWVYATAKREATNKLMDTHHLDQGGFRYEELPKLKGKPGQAIPGSDRLHKLSADDVKKITDTLTAEQKACADELVSYLSNECATQGNEASMEMFGIKKYNEEYYFPFKTASDQRYQRSDAGSTSTTNDARVKHTSFTHSLRKGANTALVMGDFFDVIADHINQMATYSSFVVPIESMNRVLNAKVNEEQDGSGNEVTIRSLLARKYGEPAQKYVADLMKDLNGGPQTDNRGAVSALFRAFKRGAVMGSLSVALQQPTAIARAFAYVNPKYFAHITMEGNKKTWERMKKYSGTTVIKDMGKFDVGTGKMANDWIANSDLQDYNVWKRGKFLLHTEGWNAVKNNWVEWATALPGVMDRVTWTHIWKAIEAEQADLNPGMNRNSDEFLTAVGKRFDDVINRTQVYDSVLAKSQNMRSKNAFAQMSTAFMAEPTLNINMLYDAVANKHTAGERAGIFASVLTSSLMAAAMASLISAWNKDDDKRKWQEKYLTEFTGRAIDSVNPLTMIPYISDLWSLANGYDIERTDLSVVQDLYQYTTSFFDKALDPDKANTWRDYENFLGTIANLTGIPLKNWSRDVRRVRNFIVTDKSASSSAGLKYTVLESVGLIGDSNKAYCQRLVAALMDGDKQEAYDLWDYLTNSRKATQNSINTNIRDELEKRVQSGEMTTTQATEILRKYAPYKNDKGNVNKPKEWLEDK